MQDLSGTTRQSPTHEQHLATGVDADQQVAFLKPLPQHLLAQQ
jgi:hypothetical protein